MAVVRVAASSWCSVAWLRRGIAPRLVASVLLFSSVITLILTLLQLYLDYRHDVGLIETRLDEIERSYLGSLSDSLWHLDEKQLALQLQGLLRLPDIRSVEIRETVVNMSPLVLTMGQRDSGPVLVREYPLVYSFQGAEKPIGVLRVEATLDEIYRDLLNKTVIILISQGAKTFLVSFFIIFIFHRLVTRHLTTIADFVSRYDLRRPPPPLTLPRRPPANSDELDQAVAAFNAMCASLERAYGELSRANAELERDIAARRRAEEALRESEKRFRDYAETASDWFWETGPDHRFTYLSERIKMFGISAAGRIGRRRWDYAVDYEDEPGKWRRHLAILERHEPFRGFVYRVRHDDGSLGFIASSGSPVFDSTGRFVGYRGVASDVTAVIRADQALREAREQQVRHQAQKIEAEAERLELLHRLVDAQEQERLRIARELHDQMGQDLTGLSLGLKSLEVAVETDGGSNTLRWLQSLTAQIGSNLHRTAWELRPTSLDDVGLVRALETYIADWSERFGIRIDFHVAGIDEICFTSSEVESTAYRLVQEALTNVLKHAQAVTVSLVLERHEDWLQIIVEDDGRGFDPDAVAIHRHLGLAGMRERLALVGGTLTIDSTIGTGTTLYFRIPLSGSRKLAKAAV
jgi:PAS domain S-box-containing protein